MLNDQNNFNNPKYTNSSVCRDYLQLKTKLNYLSSSCDDEDLDSIKSEMDFLWNLMTDSERNFLRFDNHI